MTSGQLKKLNIVAKKKVFNLFLGNYRSAFKGQGLEFEDLREYVPGDNVKDIDWNTLAKTGKLYVKKYLEHRELNVLFALDCSSSMAYGSQQANSVQSVIGELIYLLSLAAENNNDKTGAIFFNQSWSQSLQFRKSHRNTLRIVGELDKSYAQNYFATSGFERFFNFVLYALKKRTVCFLITDDLPIHDARFLKLLRVVNRRHELIVVNVTGFFPTDFGNSTAVQDVETGQLINVNANDELKSELQTEAEAQNKLINKILQKNSIGVFNLTPKQDLLIELSKFFVKRAALNQNHI